MLITGFDHAPSFDTDLKAAPADVVTDALNALGRLKANPHANSLRLHPLQGYGKPTIYKIDVRPDKSWQITFEVQGTVAVLRRLGTHKQIDRRPR